MTKRRSQAARIAEIIAPIVDTADVVEEVEIGEIGETSEPTRDYQYYMNRDVVDGIEEEALDDDEGLAPREVFVQQKEVKEVPKVIEPAAIVVAEKAMEEETANVAEDAPMEEEKHDSAVQDVMFEGDDDADISGNPPVPGLHVAWESRQSEEVEYHVPTLYEIEDAVGPDYIPYHFYPREEPPQFIWSVGELAKERIQVLKDKHSLSKRKHREDFCIFCLDFKLKSGQCSTPPDEWNHDRFQKFWLKEYPHEEVLTKQIVLADLEKIAEVWV